MMKFDSQAWRENILWNEGCDMVFKSKRYEKITSHLYKTYSGKYAGPGEKPYMSL